MICVSRDGGRTWPTSKLIGERPCRCFALVVTGDGKVLCMYTVGEKRDSEIPAVARVSQEWLFA